MRTSTAIRVAAALAFALAAVVPARACDHAVSELKKNNL